MKTIKGFKIEHLRDLCGGYHWRRCKRWNVTSMITDQKYQIQIYTSEHDGRNDSVYIVPPEGIISVPPECAIMKDGRIQYLQSDRSFHAGMKVIEYIEAHELRFREFLEKRSGLKMSDVLYLADKRTKEWKKWKDFILTCDPESRIDEAFKNQPCYATRKNFMTDLQWLWTIIPKRRDAAAY